MQLKKIICHIMPEQYSILICDDHAILLEGLKVCLQRTPGVGNVLLCTTMHNAMQLLDSGATSICALWISTCPTARA